MSNETFEVKMDVDDTAVAAKEAKWKHRLRILNAEVDKFERKVRTAAMRGFGAMSSTVSFLNLLSGYFPSAMSPVFQAAMTAVTTTLAAMTAIAASYAATGVLFPIALIVETAAVGLSIVGVFEVLKGQLKMQSEFNKMAGVVRGLNTMAQSWGRFLSDLW
jgi:hypothetical protein